MKKVSIVVPNYNNEKYILECLRSVITQNYEEKEIIVVDDGSTDNSVLTIEKFIKQNKKVDIKLICQNNLNAAMARNRGMEVADGDFVLFLDSDDTLKRDGLKKLVDSYINNDVDLVIGGYEKIDKNDRLIQKKTFVDRDIVWNVRDEFAELISFDPVPTNKLYDLKLIKENNLQWGNVRIGQDLDFYLKYLLLCKKVMILNEEIYGYRITNNSMSRKYDLRIFDIVNDFNDVERFYEENKQGLLYRQYLPTLALKHMSLQMNKQIFYENIKVRRLIVNFFAVNEKSLDYVLCKNYDLKFKKLRRNFRIKCTFWPIFVTSLYRKYGLRRRRK